MKHIRNLWNLLKQEISLWKYEKQELVKGICYIVMIAWLFFDRIAFAILLIPYLFVFMKQQRIHKVHREKEKLRKEFREMMISIGNSLSAGYSIENALKTAKNDLEMYEEHSLLAKELQLLINKLKMNEPVDKLLFDMAEHVGLEELSVCTGHINCEKKWWESDRDHGKYDRTFKSGNSDKRRDSYDDRGKTNGEKDHVCYAIFYSPLCKDCKSWIFRHTV